MSKQKTIKEYKNKYIRQGILLGIQFYEEATKDTFGIGPVLSQRIRVKALELAAKKVRE